MSLTAVALLAGGVAVVSVTTASPSTALQVDDPPDRTADLVAAIRERASIADVTAQHGVAAEDVVSVLAEKANARIDQAAADERISAKRALVLKASVAEKVPGLVNG